jgi:hypothetical protein
MQLIHFIYKQQFELFVQMVYNGVTSRINGLITFYLIRETFHIRLELTFL